MQVVTQGDGRIIEVEDGSPILQEVIELANGRSKQTLGFLPDECFAERARKGTLVALVDQERVLGYLLYDLPGYEVKIVQLCVSPEARRSGFARLLVEELISRHADRRRIILACRRDYEANTVWKALGFRPAASRPGRSKDRHMLTVWVFDFASLTLFDSYHDERATAALDHNVFLDLYMETARRAQASESRYLLDDWIGEYVELCVTDEIFIEIDRLDVAEERAAEQHAASLYRNLSRPSDGWEELETDAARLAPRAGKSDQRHVARAVAGGAKYLVSRDSDLLDAAVPIEQELGLLVLSPEQFVVHLDQLRSESAYRPVTLQGTALNQSSPDHAVQRRLVTSLLNHGDGERKSTLGAQLRPMIADRDGHEVQVIQDSTGKIVADFARTIDGQELNVPFIRVSPGIVGADVIARQLLFSQRKFAADQRLERVRITDAHLSRDVSEALRMEHFNLQGGSSVSLVKVGLLSAAEMRPRAMSRDESIDFEAAQWPVKVVGAGIETFMLAIRIPFAEALIDPRLAQHSLLPRQLGLGLNREHVYYRSTRNSRGLSKGARILWYVTGGSPVHPSGSIRAVSRVADVIVGRPRTLHARFERFGVYSLEQVSRVADGKGEVMAIRFVDTEVLERPLTIETLRDLWEKEGGRFSAPQSPVVVGEHMFRLIYQQSSAYGR